MSERIKADVKLWLNDRTGGDFVTFEQIRSEAVKSDQGRTPRAVQMIVATAMKEGGWQHERRMVKGVRTWGFVKP